MTAIAWKTAVSGNWSLTTNWNPATSPTGNDLTIGVAGANYVSTIDQSFSISSLNVASASADVTEAAGASLNVALINGVSISAGFLRLNGANTIIGNVILSGGQLDIGNSGALGAASVQMSGSGTVRGTATETIANSLYTGGVLSTVAAAHGATLTFTGGFAVLGTTVRFGATGQDGAIALMSNGGTSVNTNTVIEIFAGTLTGAPYNLTFFFGYAATTAIDVGATIDAAGGSYFIGNIAGGGTLANSSVVPCTVSLGGGSFSGAITGNTSLSINGSATLSGASAYFGQTTVSSGVLTIGNAAALSSGRVYINNGTELLASVSLGLANAIYVNGAVSTLAAATGTQMTLNGAIAFTAAGQRLALGGVAGQLGKVAFGASSHIDGFAAGDTIDLTTIAYAAGEHMALLGMSNGYETLALEDNANTILQTFNFNGAYAAANFSIANDGGGHALIGLSNLVAPRHILSDFNADGVSDVALQSGSSFVTWLMSGGMPVGGAVSALGGAGTNVVGNGDFNGDGVSDILLVNGSSLSVGAISAGSITGNAALGSTSGFSIGGTGDFNGDGTTDVLLQSNGTFVDYLVRNNAILSGNLVGSAAGWSVGGTGDFNGDGTTDILLQNNGSFVIWDMSNGALSSGFALGTAAGFSIAGAGDFNGDGTTDVLLQSGGTYVDWIIHNNAIDYGNLISTGLSGWAAVGTGDYNGDGTSDILFQAGSTVVDYTMRGGGVASGAVIGNTAGYNVVGR